MSITVYGASDDLIEVEGDVTEEFPYVEHDSTPGGGDLLAFSDGTVLRISLTPYGVWRIHTVVRGTAQVTIEDAPEGDEDNYTDRATVDGATWVVHGIGWAKR
ncbi:hypothetical protein ACWKSP_22270 [Micromonosporaceae bacterium Da 78-11]